jgi:ATP phosphoribosyltransferase
MAKENKIKFGIPGGALEESMERLFQDAGYDFKIKKAPMLVCIDDPEIECFFDRANELAFLIGAGILDGGIVSRAALLESKSNAKEVCLIGTPSFDWESSKVVLAVPERSSIKSLKDLRGKQIITRLPGITKDFLKKNKISATIEVSHSSNEAKVPELADAVVEFTNTGATLQFYNLKVLAVLLEDANTLSVIAHPKAWKNNWKKEKIESLGILLKGARIAQEYSGLMLHASNDMMEEVLKALPALKKPTVTHLRGENWFDIFTVAPKKDLRRLIPRLKEIGCTDIIEFDLSKVIV